jgi:Trypsin-like peptidase domain
VNKISASAALVLLIGATACGSPPTGGAASPAAPRTALAQGAPTSDFRTSIRQVADQVRPAVVQITNLQQQPGLFVGPGAVPAGVGSGVLYDTQGHVLTNDHVVSGAQQLQVSLPDKRSFGARLVGSDPQTDLAVIQVQADNLPVATLGDSSQLQVGDWVVAIGNALALPGGPTVTQSVEASTVRIMPRQRPLNGVLREQVGPGDQVARSLEADRLGALAGPDDRERGAHRLGGGGGLRSQVCWEHRLPASLLPGAQGDLQVDLAGRGLDRDDQARDLETRHLATAADDQHRRGNVGADAAPLEQHAGAAGDHVAQLTHPAACQSVQLGELLAHHAADDGQRRGLRHAVHDRPGQRARDADDGGHLAGGELAALHAHPTTANLAPELLLQDTPGGQQKRLRDVGSHTLRSSTASERF